MAVVVLAAIGSGFYIFNENNKRAKKLEAESYCKNDYTYRQLISTAVQALELEEVRRINESYGRKYSSKTDLPSYEALVAQAAIHYQECVEKRINR